jgi:hypothetical protein
MSRSASSLGALLGLAVLAQSGVSLADENIVREPARHPHHFFEAEPHVLLAPLSRDSRPGVGFRGTFTLAQDGFISGINDTVGLGVGMDWTHDNAYVPVVMQWNFWLSRYWSVFGEPGIALRFSDRFGTNHPDVTLYGGARFRFAERATLTFRVGYPALALGVSFLL